MTSPVKRDPVQCTCGGEPELQTLGEAGGFWICCDARECAFETKPYASRQSAVNAWNRMAENH